MQVLKETTRAKIVESAEKEFKKMGFEKASMRMIAANANMTVGNLYRYYKNKEKLFGSIVSELIVELKKLIADTPEAPKLQLLDLLSNFKELQQKYLSEWLILFGGSVGTEYKEIADKIHQTFRNSVVEVIQRSGRSPELADPIASSIIFGLNSILQSHETNKRSFELADGFLDYMIVDFAHSVA